MKLLNKPRQTLKKQIPVNRNQNYYQFIKHTLLIWKSIMNRIVISALLSVFTAGLPAFGADTADGPDLGGKDKILKESPADLGYTNVPNWLKFPPADHQDWEFDSDVVGVGVDSKDNVYVSHRGDRAPRLTVWKPDGRARNRSGRIW